MRRATDDLFAEEPSAAIAEAWEELLAGRVPAHPQMAALYGPLVDSTVVVGQMGQSLDGFIATEEGASHYVTGPESLVHLHRLRALADAVVVGWRTVAADDPRLTTRRVPGPSPVPVALDMDGRLAGDRQMYAPGRGALRVTRPGAPSLGDVESIEIESDRHAAPGDILAALAGRGLNRVLVEGGGALVSSFLDAGALDLLDVVVAPFFIGAGRPGVRPSPVRDLPAATRPTAAVHRCGSDALFRLDLRRARASSSR